MRPQGIAAYCAGAGLAVLALASTALSLAQPWLESGAGPHHARIYLTRYCLETAAQTGQCFEFPDKQVCSEHPGFCAAWKTATFALALTIGTNAVILSAIMLSWVAARRKKVAIAVRWLAGGALVADLAALQTFWTICKDERRFEARWKLGRGPLLLVVAAMALGAVFILMVFFRGLVKGPVSEEDSDSSDEDEDEDAISIDEDLEEDQRDFYLFSKHARRQAMAVGVRGG